MKLTKEQVEYLKNTKSFQHEGILGTIFAKLLKKKLKNDKDFTKAVDDADSAMEKLQARIKDMESRGETVPDGIKKYLGMK